MTTNQTPTPQQVSQAQAVYDSFDFSDQQSCDYHRTAFVAQGMSNEEAFVRSVFCVIMDAFTGSCPSSN